MFDTLEADIVVMQETKIQRKDLQDDMVLVPGWDVYFSFPKYKKGTALLLSLPCFFCQSHCPFSQDILELPYTPALPNAVPFAPRKASREYYVHPIPPRNTEIYHPSNKLAAIPDQASFPRSWTKQS